LIIKKEKIRQTASSWRVEWLGRKREDILGGCKEKWEMMEVDGCLNFTSIDSPV
jgi:hypothetical protein